MTKPQVAVTEAREVIHEVQEIGTALHSLTNESDHVHDLIATLPVHVNEQVTAAVHAADEWKAACLSHSQTLGQLGETARANAMNFAQKVEMIEVEVMHALAEAHNLVPQLDAASTGLQSQSAGDIAMFTRALVRTTSGSASLQKTTAQLFNSTEILVKDLHQDLATQQEEQRAIVRNALASVVASQQDTLRAFQLLKTNVESKGIASYALGLSNLCVDLKGKLHETAANSIGDIQSGVVREIDRLLNEISRQLDAVSDELIHSASGSGTARRLFEPLVDQVKGMMDPMKNLTDGVRQIARSVGVEIS